MSLVSEQGAGDVNDRIVIMQRANQPGAKQKVFSLEKKIKS